MIKFGVDYDFPSGLVLPIDKPYEWSSADVVRKLRVALRHLGYRKIKVGHAGTLDPLATGILLICIGKATKQAERMQAMPKEYIAEIELGATTPSYDLEHPVDERYPFEHITQQMVIDTLKRFEGESQQVPPIFSAKSINGKRAYKYARQGVEVEMKPATIEIYSIELLSFDLPKIQIAVRCSKGTYIRSLARDIGLELESGGHLTALRRTANAEYGMDDILSLDEVIETLKAPENETKKED